MIFDRIDRYVVKEFCKMFLYIILCTTTLIFFINFLEFYGKAEKYNINILDIIKIVFLRTPPVIESSLYFIILLSNSFTFTKLSMTSELIAILSNKKSIIDLIIIESILIFIFGIVYVFCINPHITTMLKIANNIERKYTNKNEEDYIYNKNGIWFKQTNMENGVITGETIFRAEELYLEKLEFTNVTVLSSTNNGSFQKRVDADSMQYTSGNFILKNCKVVKRDIEYFDEIVLQTKLTKNFLKKYMQNQYKNTDAISFINLIKLIKDFKKSGLDTTKFTVKFYIMLLIPFMYVVMIILSYAFLSINSRRQDYILNTFKTIVGGFLIFTVQNILTRLGDSGILNGFVSTVAPFILMLLITIIMVIKKVKLCNF